MKPSQQNHHQEKILLYEYGDDLELALEESFSREWILVLFSINNNSSYSKELIHTIKGWCIVVKTWSNE